MGGSEDPIMLRPDPELLRGNTLSSSYDPKSCGSIQDHSNEQITKTQNK